MAEYGWAGKEMSAVACQRRVRRVPLLLGQVCTLHLLHCHAIGVDSIFVHREAS
jgi:hypothetical protein